MELPIYIAKIIVIGDSGIGKSSLCECFINDIFDTSNYMPTIGIEFYTKNIKYNNKIIKFQIWDTAGQEKFKSITTQYYRHSVGVLVCFSLNDILSFSHLDLHLSDLNKFNNNIKKILVGTFNDHKNKCINIADIETYANKNNLEYITVSSKTGENVIKCFNRLFDYINIMHDNGEIILSNYWESDIKKENYSGCMICNIM